MSEPSDMYSVERGGCWLRSTGSSSGVRSKVHWQGDGIRALKCSQLAIRVSTDPNQTHNQFVEESGGALFGDEAASDASGALILSWRVTVRSSFLRTPVDVSEYDRIGGSFVLRQWELAVKRTCRARLCRMRA